MRFLEFLGRVLSLEPTVFSALKVDPAALGAALVLVLFAGLSEAAGQSVVLFVSRVRPRRFAFSLLLSTVLYVFSFAAFVLSVWLVARYAYGRTDPFELTVIAVGWGYAPHLFGVFTLVPYLGSLIAALLALWSLLVVTVAVHVIFGLSLPQALACSALGWLLVQLVRRTLGRPLAFLIRSLRSRVAGVPLAMDPAARRAAYRERLLNERAKREGRT